MLFDKKINVIFTNQTPYSLTFKENKLKWGRIIQATDTINEHGGSHLILSNKNNTSIIKGKLAYTVDCPLKNVELVISVDVSQGRPFVFHSSLTVEGRPVGFVPLNGERFYIHEVCNEEPDEVENKYDIEIVISCL